jgi:predicted amidohydrolase
MKMNYVKLLLLVLLLILGVFSVTACADTAEQSTAEKGEVQTATEDFVPQKLGEKPAAPESLTVGLVQFAFLEGDVEGNIKEADRLIKEAVDKGAQLVVLPELWSIGYGLDDPAAFAQIQSENETFTFMKEKALEHEIYLCGGYPELDEEGNAYDSAALFGPDGELLLNHRKVELYTPLGEDLVWQAGDRFDVVDTPLGRWGILICYDGDFPETWRILAANKDADLIIHPTAYESPCEDLGWWTKLYEANAMSNAVWAVSANMVGQTSAGNNFFGGSRIINPMGETVAEATYVTAADKAKSEVLVMQLDFAQGLLDGEESNGSIVTDRKVDVFRANGL